jgi:hypothetical protein
MIFGRRGFGIGRAIVLLFGGLAVFGYYNMRFYISSVITIFGLSLNLGYNRVILNSGTDMSKQAIA